MHPDVNLNNSGTSLVVQWLRLHLLMQGVRVRSLVGELRSHVPHGQKNQNIKQKQYCNKFNIVFKIGPHQKKILKKKTKQQPWDSRTVLCLDY